MSTTKKTTVRFLGTVEDLPEANLPRGSKGASHWNEIAAAVKAKPGVWCKFQVSEISVNAQRAAASGINLASKNGKGGILAFREPGFAGAFREGVLHVRYDAPAEASVRKIKRSAA